MSPYSFAEENVPTTTNLSDLSGITAVSITPQFGTVKAGESLQLKATGTFQDGSSRDITALLTWSAVGATIDN
ncbi:MAG: hypothetical protein OQK75_01360 [Gammaproteobacteria bacterium]|nr:hypothetical protein [Gammaproteobacteria bacterium]MCW9032060.1 hypothetical protein [Gammaproteobacteria bacterium]